MASQGPNFPAAAQSAGIAPENSDAWVNPTNIFSDNNSEAQITAATFDANDISELLFGNDYGFSIPTTATIDGIVVEIAQRRFAGAAVDNRVSLWEIGTGFYPGVQNKASATAWPATETIATYGSPTDTWGTSPVLTPTQINSSNFAVNLSVKATSNNTDIGVDFIRVTVYYTEAGGGPASGSGSPVATLSKTASGTATQTFNASGSPVATLSKTASGTATLKFNASGSQVGTLSSTASGTAVQTFNASGSPVGTLSATASGTATMTPDPPGPVSGSGSPVATLSTTASGTAVEQFNASGSPVATLSAFTTSSTAVQRFNAAGAPTANLAATASGTATMTPDVVEPPSVTGSGSPVATLSAFVVSSPRRRARGGIKFVYTDDEEKKEEPAPAAVVEAEPLPDVQEVFPMLGHVEIDPETWKRAAQGLELTRSVKPVAQAGQPIEEDEDIEDLLHVLAAIF